MSRLHALLSPSSAHIWLNCPPSARLSEQFEDKGSEFAQLGTDAHSLCQYKLEKALGLDTKDPTPDLTYYDTEMENCSDDYAAFIMETVEKAKETCPDPVVLIEQKLDFSKYVADGHGYGDCIIISDGTLHVVDYKNGVGVLVSAEMNPQMLCYALGALELVEGLYDIDKVSMTIFQPRRENVSTFEISKEDLLKWADEVLIPTAKLADAGKGEFKAGSHCIFCKCKATCKERARYNSELAKYDFLDPLLMDDSEIADVLTKVDGLVSWANDVKEYALQQAISGRTFEGFKVVEGKSLRRFKDDDAAAEAAIKAGYDPYEKKLLGITALSSQMGKKKFEEVLGELIYKAPGKPTLVPDSDKRPAMNTAANDFKEE